ncbi:MAG: DUF2800 domain-containing protein [Bacillota bacterium]
MPSDHAKLSPSSAKKWLNCTISTALESGVAEEKSAYAEEGTVAHTLGELKLKLELKKLSHVEYEKAVKELKEVSTVDEVMEEYTTEYKDFVVETLGKYESDTKVYIEMRVDLSAWARESFGTADVVILNDTHLEIIDLKYGKGVRVDAEDNYQLRLYALGCLEQFEIFHAPETVIMTIYQPRLDHISSVEMQADDLYQWGESIKAQAEKAYEGIGDAVVGNWCDSNFCKARPFCRKYNADILALEEYAEKDVNKLSNDELSEILSKVDQLNAWAKLVKSHAVQKLLSGEEIIGYKVVEGKSNRKLVGDEKAMIRAIKKQNAEVKTADFYEKKFITITTLEERYGKKYIGDTLKKFIVKPSGAPTIAKESDKRVALNSALQAQKEFAEFADENQNENEN